MSKERKERIQQRINAFATGNLADNAIALFKELGYESNRRIILDKGAFKGLFAENHTVDAQKALISDWLSADYLFQLTEEEITRQKSLFSVNQYNPNEYQSYSFVAIELKNEHYARGRLSQITREVNKLFPMPAMILFKHGNTLTLSIINRRLHKRDESKDVLEKVTLIKDIRISHAGGGVSRTGVEVPLNKGGKGVVSRELGVVTGDEGAGTHRAHIEILFDLSFDELKNKHGFTNFVELHNAWQKTLDTSELNKRFFKELANWYFWAMDNVEFPDDLEKKSDVRNATNLIRLITRLVFIWFIKEKDLLPDSLFNKNHLNTILNDFNKDNTSNVYYHAILQNLFFGTLNQKMGERGFAKEGSFPENKNEYGVKNLFRYADKFSIKEKEVIGLFKDIPFLNGGLFDCLDKPNDEGKIIYVDGFSRNPKKQADVPDFLFFNDELEVDLNEIFGTRNKKYKVKGLINLLDSYKFTVTENTPIEEEIALDPELLGKVFENLLASYNPETQTTARKQTGSFYTPREIVNYMVDESLIAYLATQLNHPPLHPLPLRAGNVSVPSPLAGEGKGEGDVCHSSESRNPEDSSVVIASEAKQSKSRDEIASDSANPRNGNDIRLRHLLSYTDEPHKFSRQDVDILIDAIDNIKVLDPACGSGAFPMGILHKLVHLLHKLDPVNEQWKKRQIEKAKLIDDPHIRQNAIDDIEAAFATNELDYGRKLYLIENCIYGVDIQPIAVQIAKLRFFISLIIDEKKQPGKENLGIRSLPNLETKFVAANTLIALDKPQGQLSFRNPEIERLEKELKELRHEYFNAKTRKEKLQCQKQDKKLRQDIAGLLVNDGWNNTTARQIAAFDLYDQNASADFFDSEWMFGPDLKNGFDIVIGNPPYVSALNFAEIYGSDVRNILNSTYESARGTYDIYILFMEKGINILKQRGLLTFITPNKYLSAKYGSAFRDFINNNTKISQVVDLSAIRVFEEAAVYPIISIIENTREQKQNITVLLPRHRNIDEFNLQHYDITEIPTNLLGLLPEKIWGFLLSRNVKLLPKIVSDSKQLECYGNINATSTAAEADKYGSLISQNNSKGSVRIVNTGTIDKYASLWGICEFTHSGERFLKPYLPLNNTIINDRRRQMYMSPKIIFAKMAKECEALLDLDGEYASINTNCFYSPNSETELEFVGAFCNSKLFMFIYDLFFGALRMSGGYYQFQAPQLRVIPLKKISKPKQQPFVELVRMIVMTKQKDPNADTSALEKQIDERIYKLYGLTYEEVKIIEPEFAMSEVEYEAFQVR